MLGAVALLLPGLARAQQKPPDLDMLLDLDLFQPKKASSAEPDASFADRMQLLTNMRVLKAPRDSESRPSQPQPAKQTPGEVE